MLYSDYSRIFGEERWGSVRMEGSGGEVWISDSLIINFSSCVIVGFVSS